MEKKKGSKRNVITAILVILAVISLVFALFMKNQLQNQKDNPQAATKNNDTENAIDKMTEADISLNKPLLKTDLTGYFYNYADDGTVTFYKYENNAYTPVTDGVSTLNVTVSMSDRDIPATVYYLNIDGKYCGYGVFLSANHPEVTVYNYALFHLTDLPSKENGKALILVNSDSSAAYKNARVWDDAFTVTLSNGSTARYFIEKNRGVDKTGAKRRDYCVATDESISLFSSYTPFFTSRDYQADANGNIKADLYTKSGSAETKVAEDVLGYFVYPTDGGFMFIKRTETGFDIMRHSDKKGVADAVVFSLTGDYNEAYARSGKYLLDKENGVVYDLTDGSKRALADYSISAMTFSVSEDGNTVLLTGTVTNALEYGVYVCDLTSNKANIYVNSAFSTLFNPCFLSDKEFNYTVMDGNMYKNVAVKV